jgi:hypothetical protein
MADNPLLTTKQVRERFGLYDADLRRLWKKRWKKKIHPALDEPLEPVQEPMPGFPNRIVNLWPEAPLIRIQEARRQASEPAEAEAAVPTERLTLAEAKQEFGFSHWILLRWKKYCPHLRGPLVFQKCKIAVGRGGRLELWTVARADLETIQRKLTDSDEDWIPGSEARELTGRAKITLERMGKRKQIPGLNGPLERKTFWQRVGKRKHWKPVEHFRREQIISLASTLNQGPPRIPGKLFRDEDEKGDWCSPALATFITGLGYKALWALGKRESCHFFDGRSWTKAAWPLERRPLRRKLFLNPGMGRKRIWCYCLDDCLAIADRLGKQHLSKATILAFFAGCGQSLVEPSGAVVDEQTQSPPAPRQEPPNAVVDEQTQSPPAPRQEPPNAVVEQTQSALEPPAPEPILELPLGPALEQPETTVNVQTAMPPPAGDKAATPEARTEPERQDGRIAESDNLSCISKKRKRQKGAYKWKQNAKILESVKQYRRQGYGTMESLQETALKLELKYEAVKATYYRYCEEI